MNLFKAIDRFIGRSLYKIMVKNEARAFLRVGYTEPEALTKIIYNRRPKTWKSYGIGLEEIRPLVDKVCEVKELKGWQLRIATSKAKSTIQNAIKQKRVVFLSETKVEYTDKGFSHYKMSYEELAVVEPFT